MKFPYPAYCMRQTDTGKPLVFFSAPATEIEQWAGVPQRKRLDARETFGFQRETKDARVDEIAAFLRNPQNVVQNPLLAASQSEQTVSFTPTEAGSPFGELVIDSAGIESLPLGELLRRLAERLRERLPKLDELEASEDHIAKLLADAQTRYDTGFPTGDLPEADESGDLQEPDDVESDTEPSAEAIGDILLADETNIVEFYLETLARIAVLDRLQPPWDASEFLGFTREAVLAYLLPVVLVDGQHRLRGAVEAAKALMEDQANRSQIFHDIGLGHSADEVQARNLKLHARNLPVSLLMDPNPSEHVFQFVVVNQKATPMNSALLGTIVSTSLGADELQPIAQRLRDARIKLEDSRAIAYLTRSPDSPFRGLVQTGMQGERGDLLLWSVLASLVRIFREFTGGRLYGFPKNDYAAIWGQRLLPESQLVAEAETASEMKELWSQPDGPWRAVFVRFFTRVRDFFGDPDDMGASNAWGSTATSNLFNKVSLTILAADYFEFLNSRKETLNSVDDVDRTFDAWLEGVNRAYFNRDWRLTNVKKDSVKVRNKWAQLWFEYRRNPAQMPPVREYGV